MKDNVTSRLLGLILAGLAFGTAGGVAMGTEQAAYRVERTDGDFQVRQYSPQVVAEILVDGTLEEAGNKAFRPLFDYISGANRAKGQIAMTAPVGQEAVGNRWAVTFMMPANYTVARGPSLCIDPSG